jgi:hypothetical protein
MFSQLYRKEMHQVMPELIIVIAISIVLNLLMYFSSKIDLVMFAFLPMIMTLGFAALLPLVSSFKTISHEWNNNTIYLLKSLPISGAMIMGAKLMALFSQFFIGTLVVGVGGALVTYHTLPQEIKLIPEFNAVISNPASYKLLAIFTLMTITMMLYFFCNSFISQMIGRLSRKLSGLITGVVFIAIIWLVGKITGFAGHYLHGSLINKYGENSLSFQAGLNSDVFYQTGIYGFAMFLAIYLTIAVVLFIIASTIYDRYLDV